MILWVLMPCVVPDLELMLTITRHAINENLILNSHAIMHVNGNLNKLNLWSSQVGDERIFPMIKLDLCSQLSKLCNQINWFS